MHSLVDHGLDALTELEGGARVIDQRAALMERESQVKLALEDLRQELAEVAAPTPGVAPT